MLQRGKRGAVLLVGGLLNNDKVYIALLWYMLLLICFACDDNQLRALMWLCEAAEVGDLSFFVTETGR